jgi:hypothetical protein
MVKRLSIFKHNIIYIAFVLIGTLMLFLPPVDPDFGWHYKYGEYIFNNASILRENTFSYTFPDYSWANSYWLSQLIMYSLSHYVGLIGMSLILSLLLALFIVWLFSREEFSRSGKVIGILSLFIIISWFTVTVRPLFFSTIFMLSLVYVLLYRQHLIKYLPLLFLIWANMHADFTLGLFVFGIYTAQKLITGLLARRIDWRLLVFSLGSVFATFINPYGVGLWETLFKEIASAGFHQNHVAEFQSLPLNFPFLSSVAILSFTGLVAASAYLSRSKDRLWYLLCVFFFFFYSFRSIYFLRPLTLIGIFSVVVFWGSNLDIIFSFIDQKIKKFSGLFYKTFIFLILLIALQLFLTNLELSTKTERWSDEKIFPYQAVQHIKENSYEGNMFNNYNWGGYLIWHLPEHKTFIDGRMASWKQKDTMLFKDYIDISDNPEEHTDLLEYYFDKYEIGFVLDRDDMKIVTYLTEEKGWEEVYKDDVAVIIKKPE